MFGVNADLSPLLVAFVGLLCGSTLGAATGFAVGLLVDLALLQTLGPDLADLHAGRLLGGRLRELRDPQAALTPLLVGAAASAASLVGYSLMEFLLGVDAPVSLELLRQIVLGMLVNTIVALPMWAIVRRALRARCPRTRAAAGAARLHDRRAQPALAQHERDRAGRRPRPRIPVSPQLALRVAIIGGVAMVMFGVIFFRLWYLQVLSGEQYVQQANANRVRDLPIAGAARGDPRPRQASRSSPAAPPTPCRSCPRRCRPAGPRRAWRCTPPGPPAGDEPGAHRARRGAGAHRLPYAPVTIKTDAGPGVLTVLGERHNEFPGVIQQPVSIRAYPYGDMAAQVLGYVGQVSEAELEAASPFRGVHRERSSARKGSSTTTTATCAASPGSSVWRSTPTATPCPEQARARPSRRRATACR